MKQDVLEKYILRIRNWLEESEGAEEVFLCLDRDVVFNFFSEFNEELNANLSEVNRVEEKRFILKSYLLKLQDLQKMLYEYRWFIGSLSFIDDLSENNVITSEEYIMDSRLSWEEYVIAANHYVVLMMDAIEKACKSIGSTVSRLSEEIGRPSDLFSERVLLNLERLKLRTPRLEEAYPEHTYEILKEKIQEITNTDKVQQSLGTLSNFLTKSPLSFSQALSKSHILPSKSQILKESFRSHGFFELKKIEELHIDKIDILFNEICLNDLPFKIAMMDYLGFLKHLSTQYFNTKGEINKFLAKNFDTTDRNVRGNINVLQGYSKEDKERYTAHLFIEKVKEFYQTLI